MVKQARWGSGEELHEWDCILQPCTPSVHGRITFTKDLQNPCDWDKFSDPPNPPPKKADPELDLATPKP